MHITLDDYIVSLTESFCAFSDLIARGLISELAPPFLSYLSFKGDIISYYNWFFEKYNKYLNELNSEDLSRAEEMMSILVRSVTNREVVFSLKDDINGIERLILDTAIQYFKGFPGEAFCVFEKGMNENNQHLFLLLPQLEVTGGVYYRVRKGDFFSRMKSTKELFHVPFEKRMLCSTNRYSISGYPSLYLSQTLRLALLETDISKLRSYNVSAFKQVGTLRFIDMALTRSFNTIWERYSLLVYYPLIMACGLKVRYPKYGFKPEYVIPQILSQTIRLHMVDNSFDGISYISCKEKHPNYMEMNQRDYVLWIVGADKEEGYSSALAEKFVVTPPQWCTGFESPEKTEQKIKGLEWKDVLSDQTQHNS